MNPNNPNNPQHPGAQPRPASPQHPGAQARPAGPQHPGAQARPMNPQQGGPQPRPVNPQQRPVMPQQGGPQPRPVNPQQRPVMPQQGGPQPRPVNPHQHSVMPQQGGPQPRPVNPQQHSVMPQQGGPQPRPVNPQQRPVMPQQGGPQPRPVNPQQRPVMPQQGGPQPRPVNPQQHPVMPQQGGPQPRPVNPQQHSVMPQRRPEAIGEYVDQNSSDTNWGAILGGTGAATGIAGAVLGGMALYKQNQFEKRFQNGEIGIQNREEDFQYEEDLRYEEDGQDEAFGRHRSKKPRCIKPSEVDSIVTADEQYYITKRGKRIIVFECISMDDWDRYTEKLQEILTMVYGHNPLQEYSFEAISSALLSVRHKFTDSIGLPARISEELGVDENNDILLFKPLRLPEQPDFTPEDKDRILSDRERIVNVKKRLLGKNSYLSNSGVEYVIDREASSAIQDKNCQREMLFRVLRRENIEDWIRGDEENDIKDCIRKIKRNFSYGESYPILFFDNIALTPDDEKFVILSLR